MLFYIFILTIISVAVGFIFKNKFSHSYKKKFSEKFFISISGLSALFIIVFILYLLIHIFVLGKSHLTWEFLFSSPEEGLTKGGIFPAIVGTSLLVLIMSIIGVPIGTITAIYLSEYSRENSIFTKSIRFAVKTLASVPAIVFGLFGLGFFIGIIGNQMDTFEANKRIEKMEIIFNSSHSPFENDGKATESEIRNLLANNDNEYWREQIDMLSIFKDMFGTDVAVEKPKTLSFFEDRTRPRWGQPSLLWASLTMALLTLPIVIVTVEEAIRTIPKDLREASLALGATKLSTILRVVIPGALPGILTGTILTISRGAGEVAPILFTGVAYYLPDLPNSLSSQFMHLGYHIYVLSTQSTDVELTKPLQYATTFVLLMLTFLLNFSAVFLRSRIRSNMAKHS